MGTPVYQKTPQFEQTLNNGAKNVTTAGTAVQLSTSSLPCEELLIQAKRTNTGRIYVGGLGITNDDTTGVYLLAGQTIPMTPQNLNRVYLNSSVNGEGVTYTYLTA